MDHVRDFIEKNYPEYYGWFDYPADKTAAFCKVDAEWGILGNFARTPLTVGCVHGKMKPKEKDAAMDAFVRGETDILVSTTVVEVGVDVPNASLMIVENAERFGLSQLHQLRGRVGRGVHKSWCVLMAHDPTEEAKQRLRVLVKTSDGFAVAEEDLKLRGPGDFFGSRQHGLPEMHIAELTGSMDTLKEAQEAAKSVIEMDPELIDPELTPLREHIARLFELNENTWN